MKKKQFINYMHHSHTKTNEARDHHIRLLEPLAKMRYLSKFIDKPICKDHSYQQYCPIRQQVLRSNGHIDRQVDEMPNGRLL